MPEDVMAKSQFVVPANERQLTDVQIHKNKIIDHKKCIAEVQSACEHDYRPLEAIDFDKSLVPGVCIDGSGKYPLECLKCCHQIYVVATEVCPECGSRVKRGGVYPIKTYSNQERGLYWERDLSWAYQLHGCTECNFKIVTEYWDR